MIALVSVLIVLILSLLIIRIVAVALTLTGLSPDVALFQAVSAFTGVGFTTYEAETVINHPVRRHIILTTMILGNAGIITTISSLVLTFMNTGSLSNFLLRLLLLAAGLIVLWWVAISHWVNHYLSQVISRALKRWTDIDTRDYASLLNLSGQYGIVEIQIQSGDWLADKTLIDLALNQEGVLVLGIYRQDGYYVGAPTGNTKIDVGDMLILYGRTHLLAELDHRQIGSGGDAAHREAIVAQSQILDEQARQDLDS